jgi:hypothetical protein
VERTEQARLTALELGLGPRSKVSGPIFLRATSILQELVDPVAIT